MSVLAGFDAVIELGVGVIADKLRRVSFGGSTLDPPTEVSFGDTVNGADILILDPITIALGVGSDGISATVPFDDSTIYYNGQTVRPVKGVVTIAGEIRPDLINPSDTSSTLSDLFLVVPGGGVDVQWDGGVSTQSALESLKPTDRSSMENAVKSAIWYAINTNQPRAQLNFDVDDSRNGLLGNYGLRFRSVTVQNIDSNTIGVFCMALLSTPTPSAVVRSEPGLVGKVGAAISLSEATFQKLIFCPSIAEKFLGPWDPTKQTADDFASDVAANMPSACGNGDFVTLTGYSIPLLGSASLKAISAAYQDGSVLISGEIVAGVASNDYCWRIAIDFSTNADFSVNNGAVAIKLDPDPPNTSAYVDVNWYCVGLYIVALAVAAAPTAGIILGSPLVDGITSMLVSKFVNKPLNLNQTEQVGLTGLELLEVVVTPDRLTMLGSVSTPPPSQPQVRGVTVEISSEHPENVTEVGTGTYHFPGSVVCKAKDYPYAEYTQQDVLTISASEHLMGSAPSFSWTVAGEAITDISGTLTVAVPATIPQPGDLPGKDTVSLGMQTATVDYRFNSPTELVLTGYGGFDYSVNVAVQGKSLEGYVSSDNLFASFTDRVMQMGGGYDQDMASCALATRLLVNNLRTRSQGVPLTGDPPNYGETVQVLGEAIRQGRTGATEMLIALSDVFGNQIYADVLRSSAGQV